MAKGGGAEVGATKRGKGMSHRRMKRLSRRRSCVGGFAAIGAVWRDQLDPVSSQFIVERVAVVGAITDQIFWLGFNHVEVEAQLHQANFMMIGGVRAYRKRQSMTIDNRHDFHAFSALRCADFCPTAFSHYECRIDEAFFFIERTSVAKLVGNIRQHPPQGLVAAPSLEASMHRFVVRKALWQHMPLRTRVEDP